MLDCRSAGFSTQLQAQKRKEGEKGQKKRKREKGRKCERERKCRVRETDRRKQREKLDLAHHLFSLKKKNKKHKTARDSSDVAAAGTDS